MIKTHKQSFMQGVIILGVTNLIVKMIGATFKIPLRALIGVDGMGIYTQAYGIYIWLFVIATAGMPVAISKMVSESIAVGRYKEANKIFNVSLYLLSIIGILGSAVLFFGANLFVHILRDPKVYYAILAIAPSLFFVGIMSAYRGYFQGKQNMIPTAVSEVVEVLCKLCLGFYLAYIWSGRGIEYSSAGAILGVTTGTALGAIILGVIYSFSKKRDKQYLDNRNGDGRVKSSKQIIGQLITIAIPITVGASVFSLTSVIDVAMIKFRLQAIGYSEDYSRILFGYYQNDAITLFNLPPTIIVALSVGLVPAVAKALAVRNTALARFTTESALRITILFSLPCAAGLSILAGPILKLVFNDANASPLLIVLAIAVLFVAIVLVTNAILQATGRVMIPVKHMLIGGIIKVIANYFLVGYPAINIMGAPIGSNLCYLYIMIMNLVEVRRTTGAKYKLMDFIIKPLVAVAAMGISVVFIFDTLFRYTGSNSISTLGAILGGGIIYGLMLMAVGGIKKDDLEMLPSGDKAITFLNKFGLLK